MFGKGGGDGCWRKNENEGPGEEMKKGEWKKDRVASEIGKNISFLVIKSRVGSGWSKYTR